MILQNKTLWLIGASSGIGAALAPALAAQGVRLALSSRREEELKAVADSAALKGRRPLVKPLDVTDLDAIRRVYGELVAEWGKVDVLFYNSGIGGVGEVSNLTPERAAAVAEVNYVSLLRATAAVLPDMLARRSGEIVGMASLAGYAGFPRSAVYSSSKAGASAYLQALRIELRRVNVGVTTVNPGYVKTPLTDNNTRPMPFLITPEAAATAIVKGLLAGDEEIHFPKRLSWFLKVYTALPRPIYEALARRFMT